jgi:hypothetical protein
LTAGGGETDLYLGSDSQYVKVDHSGDIVVGTLGANTSTWTFGTNGILTLPALTPIIKGGGTGTDVTVIASTGSNTSTWVFGANGVLSFPGSGGPTISNTGEFRIWTTSTDITVYRNGRDGYGVQEGEVNVFANNGHKTRTTDLGFEIVDGYLKFPDATVQTTAWNDQAFHDAMESYDGFIDVNTATIGVGGLTVNGPVTFNSTFSFLGTATVITSNSGTFYGDVYGVGALYAGVAGFSPLPSTVVQSAANVNAYIQNNFQNINNGTQASTEWVATANNGDDSNHYLDMGIAGSAWDGSQSNSVGTAASANDSWIYAQGSTSTSAGGNLILGTIKNGKAVKILAGSTGSSSIVATFNGSGLTLNTGTLTFADGTVQSTAATAFNTGTLVTTAVTAQGLTAGVTLTAVANAGTTSTTAAGLGYIGMPQNSTATSYTLVAGDQGKHIYVTATGQTITVPANATTAFPVGTTIAIIAGPSATTVSIAITSDTMYLGGTGTTGTRTLAAFGMATLVKVTATTWFISGSGLT